MSSMLTSVLGVLSALGALGAVSIFDAVPADLKNSLILKYAYVLNHAESIKRAHYNSVFNLVKNSLFYHYFHLKTSEV
jgi:hypothetical protein